MAIHLGLSCHIIEPEHPYEFVSRHEEGHRRINEYFYQFGPQAADVIGKSMIGRQFTSTETDQEAAKAQVLPQAQIMVQMGYISRIEKPCREANNYYDQLQDPEGVHLDVDLAVQKAIAKYSDEINVPPPTAVAPPFTRNQSIPASGFRGVYQ